jgi:hypothetical protein
MLRTAPFLLATAVLFGALPASAQTLTRIETKPFYGAVVTIEEGVRVYRPLPSTSHMIINPGGRTPVNLSINEYHDHSSAPAVVPVPVGGGHVVVGGGGGGWPLRAGRRSGWHGNNVGHYVKHVAGAPVGTPRAVGGRAGRKGGGHH